MFFLVMASCGNVQPSFSPHGMALKNATSGAHVLIAGASAHFWRHGLLGDKMISAWEKVTGKDYC